jgi:2-polyprenyl-6-hydroxyphenyl methylase / 3-demethylubiquinone-9 3-methyltransferase
LEQQGKAYSRIKNLFIRELLCDLKHKRFLDYGCGAGMFLVYAAKQNAARITGVDAEESVLLTARFFAHKEGVENKCEFLVNEHFPSFPPHTFFDVILFKDVIEHIESDQRLLDAAAKHLAPGGILVLSTQNAFSFNYLIEGTCHRILRNEKDWFGWDPTHLRFYTPWGLRAMLKKAGLLPVDWRSAYIVPHKIPAPQSSGRQFYRIESLTYIDKILGHVFPFKLLGWNIIIKAVKSASSV